MAGTAVWIVQWTYSETTVFIVHPERPYTYIFLLSFLLDVPITPTSNNHARTPPHRPFRITRPAAPLTPDRPHARGMSVVEDVGVLKARATDFSIAAIMGAAAKMSPQAREGRSTCSRYLLILLIIVIVIVVINIIVILFLSIYIFEVVERGFCFFLFLFYRRFCGNWKD